MANSDETKSVSTTPGSGLSGLPGANSTRLLIAVNTIPAVGVLFFGWDAFNVVFLFWLENLVIGLFAALKMITAGSGHVTMENIVKQIPVSQLRSRISNRVDTSQLKSIKVSLPAAINFFLIPFFCVHYGGFMLGHGIFIVFLLGDGEAAFQEGGFIGVLNSSWHYWMWAALAGLVLEHGREFLSDYLGKGKNKQTTAAFQMFAPYGRIIVMHLVIIVGGFLLVSWGLPRLMAVLLVVAKTLMELANQKLQRATDLGALTD